MDTAEVLVTVAGIAAAGWVVWYFWLWDEPPDEA
jgi:hypothetical protein